MQRSSAKRRIGSHAPTAAIVLSQASKAGQHSTAGLLLVLFMRIVAALWIIEGLVQWSTVMQSSADGRSTITALATPALGIVVFFAIIDLIASVGLWLSTPWGGVIWLVSVSAQLLVALFVPDFYTYRWLTVLADVGLISLYMMLTWRVALANNRPLP